MQTQGPLYTWQREGDITQGSMQTQGYPIRLKVLSAQMSWMDLAYLVHVLVNQCIKLA